MSPSYWQKQSTDQPLFPDILWERPERRDLAGRLLIVGGNAHGFRNTAESYQAAIDNQIGQAKVLLPEPLRALTNHLPDIVYGPAGATGSLSAQARDQLYALGAWAEGVLLAGDSGKNSETTILLQQFIRSYRLPIIITKDAVELLTTETKTTLSQPNLIIIPSAGQWQKLLTVCRFPLAYTHSLQLAQVVELLHQFTSQFGCSVVLLHGGQLCAAHGGQVVTTPRQDIDDLWQNQLSAKIAVFVLQNPKKVLEAIATACHP